MDDGDRIFRALYEEWRTRPVPGPARHRLDPDHEATTEEIRLSERPTVHVYEPTDPRLNRHVVHDPRSRAYALPAGAPPAKAITWPRIGPVLDQGQLGCCTAAAAYGLMMTMPFTSGKYGAPMYTMDDVKQLYREETRLDDREIPGHWEPTDTGSAGIYAMKALQNRKLIAGYSHAFSLDAALAALATGPIAVGTVWLYSMENPGADGFLKLDQTVGPNGTTVRKPEDAVAGGHEYVIDSWDPAKDAVRMTNSWGTSWGQGGSAWIRRTDFGWLLSQQGDVVQPSITVAPTPQPPGPVNPTPPKPSVDLNALLRDIAVDLAAVVEKIKAALGIK